MPPARAQRLLPLLEEAGHSTAIQNRAQRSDHSQRDTLHAANPPYAVRHDHIGEKQIDACDGARQLARAPVPLG